MLVFGIIEFGRLIHTFTTVRNASREAARYGTATGESSGGVPRYADCAGIREAAKRVARMPSVTDGDITVTYQLSGGGSAGSCAGGGPGALDDGSRIVVTVTRTFDSNLPFISAILDDIEVSSTTRRSIWP
jgi:Flp pilus assembly protein TadG